MTNICEAVTATNCATLSNFNQCATCAPKHYLDSTTKLCTPIPEPIIPNCQIYAFHDVTKWKYKCVSCKENFFLKDNKTCSAVTIDANCDAYSTTASTTSCIRCKKEKLLVTGTCTTDRNPIIANCLTHSPTLNKCEVCADTYTLNADGSACKKVTPYCKTPLSFNTTSAENIKCSKCIDEYYLAADGTCVKGGKNCKEYSSETQCTSCLN